MCFIHLAVFCGLAVPELFLHLGFFFYLFQLCCTCKIQDFWKIPDPNTLPILGSEIFRKSQNWGGGNRPKPKKGGNAHPYLGQYLYSLTVMHPKIMGNKRHICFFQRISIDLTRNSDYNCTVKQHRSLLLPKFSGTYKVSLKILTGKPPSFT